MTEHDKALDIYEEYGRERIRGDQLFGIAADLLEALEPFAAFADAYLTKLHDEQAASRDDSIVYRFNNVTITVGMFRAARAAIANAKAAQED